jgi:hypothetical protein
LTDSLNSKRILVTNYTKKNDIKLYYELNTGRGGKNDFPNSSTDLIYTDAIITFN